MANKDLMKAIKDAIHKMVNDDRCMAIKDIIKVVKDVIREVIKDVRYMANNDLMKAIKDERIKVVKDDICMAIKDNKIDERCNTRSDKRCKIYVNKRWNKCNEIGTIIVDNRCEIYGDTNLIRAIKDVINGVR